MFVSLSFSSNFVLHFLSFPEISYTNTEPPGGLITGRDKTVNPLDLGFFSILRMSFLVRGGLYNCSSIEMDGFLEVSEWPSLVE